MKTVIWKVFFNFEKEEKWLNDMAAKGLSFIDYTFGRYLFEEGTPGEYIYRLELLNEMPSHAESKAYIKFMEESGIECVSTYLRWAFFRKKAADGPFDLYSDYDSRIKHYKRVIAWTAVGLALNLFAALLNVFIGLRLGSSGRSSFNLYFSTISWAVTIILIPMLISYIRKIFIMKKEKNIYE
ncbi:hypothetical protein OXPF_30250 [Oxobacter pfennigii]|uniref:DUF2812 domain-containing protein n=1 Tax=Oxobacter pfennigii TaxID=36849 RepID=A0A0N8NT17_9CLOT|nr:DUF2812 domain-containing protein [Oxobacter pfennigii]KPU43584.1 hypothetical protein OXPF_30250 [Oxobacter pfennigii]